MKIYIEQSANDIVDVVDWEGPDETVTQPGSTDLVDDVEGFDDMFQLDQRLRYDVGGSRWDAEADEDIPYYDQASYVADFIGRSLIYCKSNGVVTWDNVTFDGSIELTTDATDSDEDGVPDIDADGTSTCTITIKKRGYAGDYATAAEDDDTISLSLTRGSLSLLSVDLVNGVASVTLTSVSETVNTIITATADALEADSIEIQFTPTS